MVWSPQQKWEILQRSSQKVLEPSQSNDAVEAEYLKLATQVGNTYELEYMSIIQEENGLKKRLEDLEERKTNLKAKIHAELNKKINENSIVQSRFGGPAAGTGIDYFKLKLRNGTILKYGIYPRFTFDKEEVLKYNSGFDKSRPEGMRFWKLNEDAGQAKIQLVRSTSRTL